MNKTTKNIVTVCILLLILGLIAYPKIKENWGSNKNRLKDKPEGSKKAFVSISVVRPRPLDNALFTTGTLLPNEEVELTSEIAGKITAIDFKEGDKVRKDDILLRIYDEDLKAQFKKLNYNRALLENNESRQKRLLEKEAISQQEYDQALTQLNVLKAEIQNLQSQLTRTVVRSPFDGTIGLRHVSAGAYITPATKIATLLSLNPVKIEFAVPAKYAASMKAGKKVSFTVEGDTEQHEATIYAVNPRIDEATRTLLVRATNPNKANKLYPGAFANVRFVLDKQNDAILVPTEAIVPIADGHQVYIAKQGKAQAIKVKIGLRTANEVQVLEGLQAGDSLIVSGIQQVKPGIDVTIQP